ncbi:Alpha/Beta hydrolase protein [Phycomyces blakesleeanus]
MTSFGLRRTMTGIKVKRRPLRRLNGVWSGPPDTPGPSTTPAKVSATSQTHKFHRTRLSPPVVTPSPVSSPVQESSIIPTMQDKQMHPLDNPSVESYFIPGAKVFDRYFDCPLAYKQKSPEKIKVFARHLVPVDKVNDIKTMPFFLYLQGGPGFEVGLPSSATSGWIKEAFAMGFQVLLLDQRGTGLSSPISTESLAMLGLDTDQAKAGYLTFFRADSIVRDCETIREQLTADRAPDCESRFTLLGQSFGGFCITTYLSLFPTSIQHAYITGGVPPLVNSPDVVYRALYPRILAKNKLYYKKFPHDIERVRKIHAYLSQNQVRLPNGGTLSPRRFLQLGILFGVSGGYDTLHENIVFACADLDSLSRLSYRTLNRIQELQGWDTNVIYAVLHEAIYCQGEKSNWSAERVLNEPQFASAFEWRLDQLNPGQPVYFTGETIYPFMFDDYSELAPLKKIANLLAENTWGKLYSRKTLKTLTTPVAGVTYYDDMFVDRELSVQTAGNINGFKQWITNEYAHNGLRVDGERVLSYLVKLGRGDSAYDR